MFVQLLIANISNKRFYTFSNAYVITSQTLVLRDDMDAAAALLPSISSDHHARLARFLEGLAKYDQALELATDPEVPGVFWGYLGG